MADAGEGLIDAQNRIQERMDEREEERARRATRQAEQDPERMRRAESLRLAHTELSRQLVETKQHRVPVHVPLAQRTAGSKHDARKKQLTSALAELDRQLAAMSAARPAH